MSIQSLGVGSGLELEDLVTQLIAAERGTKEDRLNEKEETVDAEISAIGQLKSKMTDFLDSVYELKSEYNLAGREPTIKNPSEDVEPFTAEASNSALEGDYAIAVEQLASGSRFETADAVDGGYSSSSDSVLSSGSGSLTFKIDSTGDTFSISVTAGMTVQQLRNAINSSDDNFGVTASIITTGTDDGGVKLVFTSETTGEGNDLVIVNDNDLADLQAVSTTDSTETLSYLTAVESAQNAIATIDGIEVQSSSNEFENTIENVSFEVSDVSETDSSGNYLTSKLTIGFDKEGLREKLDDFIETFNSLNSTITTLTRYGQSELEDDGELAGDFMVRAIQSGMANIVTSNVSGTTLGGLFQLGIDFNDDGELEISDYDEYGFGSGEDRLSDAMDDYYDDIATILTDSDEGIAARLYDYVKEYTTYNGLLKLREDALKDQKDQISDERERFELHMTSFEETLRKKYVNLDQTVASLNSASNAMLAALG